MSPDKFPIAKRLLLLDGYSGWWLIIDPSGEIPTSFYFLSRDELNAHAQRIAADNVGLCIYDKTSLNRVNTHEAGHFFTHREPWAAGSPSTCEFCSSAGEVDYTQVLSPTSRIERLARWVKRCFASPV